MYLHIKIHNQNGLYAIGYNIDDYFKIYPCLKIHMTSPIYVFGR